MSQGRKVDSTYFQKTSAPRMSFQCKRKGCPFRHRWKIESWHGFCCNACKRGEAQHTQNCGGRKHNTYALERASVSDTRTNKQYRSISASSNTPYRSTPASSFPAPNDISSTWYSPRVWSEDHQMLSRHGGFQIPSSQILSLGTWQDFLRLCQTTPLCCNGKK